MLYFIFLLLLKKDRKIYSSSNHCNVLGWDLGLELEGFGLKNCSEVLKKFKKNHKVIWKFKVFKKFQVHLDLNFLLI